MALVMTGFAQVLRNGLVTIHRSRWPEEVPSTSDLLVAGQCLKDSVDLKLLTGAGINDAAWQWVEIEEFPKPLHFRSVRLRCAWTP